MSPPLFFSGEEYTRSNFPATQVWPAVFVGEGWGRLEGVRFLNYVLEAVFLGWEDTSCVFHMCFYAYTAKSSWGTADFLNWSGMIFAEEEGVCQQ